MYYVLIKVKIQYSIMGLFWGGAESGILFLSFCDGLSVASRTFIFKIVVLTLEGGMYLFPEHILCFFFYLIAVRFMNILIGVHIILYSHFRNPVTFWLTNPKTTIQNNAAAGGDVRKSQFLDYQLPLDKLFCKYQSLKSNF